MHVIKAHTPIKLNGQVYDDFLDKCDNVFAVATLYILCMPTHHELFLTSLDSKISPA